MVVEGRKEKHDATKSVFETMSRIMDWHEKIYVKMDMNYQEAIKLELGGHLEFLPEESSHALVCTWDGFITNPHLWSDEWLRYDMVGSPWPKSWNTGNQVGNMGFCLLSRRFLEAAHASRHLHRDGEPSDVFLCQRMSGQFAEQGIMYAPVESAARFGWEHDVEMNLNGPDKSFGFHGWHHGRNQKAYYDKLEGQF